MTSSSPAFPRQKCNDFTEVNLSFFLFLPPLPLLFLHRILAIFQNGERVKTGWKVIEVGHCHLFFFSFFPLGSAASFPNCILFPLHL